MCGQRDENGNTLLHCAAQNGLRGMCKVVLRVGSGRPLNLQNVRGEAGGRDEWEGGREGGGDGGEGGDGFIVFREKFEQKQYQNPISQPFRIVRRFLRTNCLELVWDRFRCRVLYAGAVESRELHRHCWSK